MPEVDPLICTSCAREYKTLNATKSKLMPVMIFLCENCRREGYEPRALVVLSAREGNSKTKNYIKNNKYIGDDILAKEIL